MNGVFNVNVTSLERQFHLRSTELGFISGSYDLSAAFFGIFISYLGSGQHKPRWLTMASVVMAIASLLIVLPHFTSGKYEWGEKRISTCNLDGNVCFSKHFQYLKHNKHRMMFSVNMQKIKKSFNNLRLTNYVLD